MIQLQLYPNYNFKNWLLQFLFSRFVDAHTNSKFTLKKVLTQISIPVSMLVNMSQAVVSDLCEHDFGLSLSTFDLGSRGLKFASRTNLESGPDLPKFDYLSFTPAAMQVKI